MIKQIKKFIEDKKNLLLFLKEFKQKVKLKKMIVVGSSKILLENKNMKYIDDHDSVIRFNLAPTLKFEKFVGKKTDIIVCNHLYFSGKVKKNYIMKLKKQKNKIILVIVDHQNKNYVKYLQKNKNNFVDISNVVLFFNNNLNSILRFHMISKYNYFKKFYYYKFIPKFTGGLIISSVLKMVDAEFKMIGFNLKKKNSNVDYYYQKADNKKKMGSGHDFEKENNIILSYFSEYI